MNWEPLLAGPVRDEAWDAIVGIAVALSKPTGELPPSYLCDYALLFAYLDMADPGKTWETKSIEYAHSAAESLSTAQTFRNDLYGGISGAGWILHHLTKLLPAGADLDDELGEQEDPLVEIDSLLLSRVRAISRDGAACYDLISGLVGIGVYFLERLPLITAREGIRCILDYLEVQAEHSKCGVTWFTSPELVPESERESYPSGYYNLGVAHGIPGVIQFLGEVVASHIEPDRCLNLLAGAVNWLLAQQRPIAAISAYSSVMVPGLETGDSRLAWCYGDLGIAAILHHTARRIGRHDWRAASIGLLDRCLSWPIPKTRISDASLCHGALGVAHIFNRIYHDEGSKRYKEAANFWYARGLGLREPGVGVAGFFAWRPRDTPAKQADASFLSGAAGAALALISATNPIDPQWDRLLLLSGCRRS